jgi:IclR helix-turn-helix domain
VVEWSFLTSHARVLLCIAHDPGVRLRDIAARVGITERSAYGIVTDLTNAGYVMKKREGRRNRYQVQTHLPLRVPLPMPGSRERTIGEILALLTDVGDPAAGLSPRKEEPAVPPPDGSHTGTAPG